jgi:hypothetical protein
MCSSVDPSDSQAQKDRDIIGAGPRTNQWKLGRKNQTSLREGSNELVEEGLTLIK